MKGGVFYMLKTSRNMRFVALMVTVLMIVGMFAGLTSNVSAASASSIASVSTYGNFITAGIDIKINNMNFNESATIEYKKTTDSTYKQGHYFVRYDGNHMATSLFNLQNSTTYDIKITLSDPDGVSGTNPYYTTVTTKAEFSLPTPLRTVNVANQTDFDSAIKYSQPGDEIRVAAGTYDGWDAGSNYNQGYSHSGTAAHPIVITYQGSIKPYFRSFFSLQGCNYIILDHLEITNVSENHDSLSIRGSHNDVVSNCYVHDGISGSGTHVIEIDHSNESDMPGYGGHLIINNIISDEVHDPVDINHGPDVSYAAAPGQTYTGIGLYFDPGGFVTIRGNKIYGVTDGVHTGGDEGWDTGLNDLDTNTTVHDQNLDFYDNTIYNCKDDGIESDGHSINGRFFNNHIGDSQCAISSSPLAPGPVFFVRNYVSGFNEQCSKQNTGVEEICRNVFFYQNTFIEKARTDGTSGYCFYRGEPAHDMNFTYKNNIFYAQGRVYGGDMYTDNTSYYQNYTFDYNTMFSTRTTDTIYLYKYVSNTADPLNNTRYTDLASYQSATGFEAHGTYGYPALDQSTLSGYAASTGLVNGRILGNSAAIDKAVVIPGINDTYNGSAPDCGAYETNGTEPTALPTTTPIPTSTPTPTSTPVPIGSGTTISNLGVYDGANAVDWSIQQNLQVGNLTYGDRTFTMASVVPYLVGKEWIRPANDSKTYTGATLCTFTVVGNTDVYIAHNNGAQMPAWLSSWTNTGDTMNAAGNVCTLFKKTYTAGSRVDLGNSGDTSASTYFIIINPIGGSTSTPVPTATNTPTPTPTNTPIPTATPTPTSGGPSGYIWCANEGGTVNFGQTVDVAYGANGSYYYRYGVTGDVTFDNNNFGDPIPGVVKNGYYRIASATVTPTAIPTPTPGSTNLALNKTVTASSSCEDWGWFLTKVVDGERSVVSGASGWSSNDNLYSNHTVWVTVDLGASKTVNRVDLYPRNDSVNTGYGFPIDFTISVSNDNSTWTNVITRTSYAQPGGTVQSFAFSNQTARYIKIQGTSLRQNPNDSSTYRMQFAEIEAYGGAAPTSTSTPTATATPTPTATNTPTNTPTATATPVTKTLQVGVSGYTSGKDQSYMPEAAPNTGYYGAGQAPLLYVRGGNNILIYFNLTNQIPSGATIDSASLSLYNTNATTAYTGGTINLYRILDPNNKGMWVEGSTSDGYTKDGASWLRRAGTGDGVTAGWTNTANSTIMDSANSTSSGTLTFNANTAGWVTSTDLKSDIQAYVNGTAVNQGWYIRADGTSINVQEVASNQYATASYRPKLTVMYH
jgi:hypothetical protein